VPRYVTTAAAWLAMIWAFYAWFHDHHRGALLVFATFGVGAVWLAIQLWRDERSYKEWLRELESTSAESKRRED
jgi:hypothetical protein